MAPLSTLVQRVNKPTTTLVEETFVERGCKKEPFRKSRKRISVKYLLCLLLLGCVYLFELRSILGVDLSGLEKTFLLGPKTQRFAKHDEIGRFSVMLSRDRSLRNKNKPGNSGELVIDALSIGSQNNMKLIEAQSLTWASHYTIRHFFAAIEADDADPNCHKAINSTDLHAIRDLCQKQQPLVKDEALKSHIAKEFGKNYLKKGPGWMCAQQRFATAFTRMGRFYQNQLEVDPKALPDFLLIQDDDSYFNMLKMNEFFTTLDPSRPMTEAPCLIEHVKGWKFSYPWGGFGFILSKGAIENLIRPIYCKTKASDQFEENVCSRLEENLLGEARFFEEGMSVSDLMGAHVDHNLFKDYDKKGWSYCLHGDWAIGYYVNYYYISAQVKDPKYKNVNEFRIESQLGGGGVYSAAANTGNCVHDKVETCNMTAHVCHKQTVESMLNLTQQLAAEAPDEFDFSK